MNIKAPFIDELLPFHRWRMHYTPVIPTFYWDSVSPEQQLLELCRQWDAIIKYEDLQTAEVNEIVRQVNEMLASFDDKLNADVIDAVQAKIDDGTFTPLLEAAITQWMNERSAQVDANTAAIVEIGSKTDSLIMDVESVKEDYVKCFDTVADIKNNTDLRNGMICHTNGFYEPGDNGAGWYVISDDATANEMDIIECRNGLFAVLIENEGINIAAYGCKTDGSYDCSTIINYAIEKVRATFNAAQFNSKICNIDFPSGTYRIDNTIEVSPFCKLRSNGNVKFDCHVNNGACMMLSAKEGDYIEPSSGREEWFAGKWLDFNGLYIENAGNANNVAIEIGSKERLAQGSYIPTSRYTLEGLYIRNFHSGIVFNPYDNFIGTIRDFRIETATNGIVSVGAGENTGERMTFEDFVIAGCTEYAITYGTNALFQSYFRNGSFDFNTNVVNCKNTGNPINFEQCHFEGNGSIVDGIRGDNGIMFNECYLGFSREGNKLAKAESFTYGNAANTVIFLNGCYVDLFGTFNVKDSCNLAPADYPIVSNCCTFQNREAVCFNNTTAKCDSYMLGLQAGTLASTETYKWDLGSFTAKCTTTSINGYNAAIMPLDVSNGNYARFTVTNPAVTTAIEIETKKVSCVGGRNYYIAPLARYLYKNIVGVTPIVKFFDIDGNELPQRFANSSYSYKVASERNPDVWEMPVNWCVAFAPANAAYMTVKTTLSFWKDGIQNCDFGGLFIVER